MAVIAPLALGLGGAAIGASFGWMAAGVNIGAVLGWFAGVTLANILFPQKAVGPSLSDTRIQGSSYGNPIPLAYGTNRVGGTVIDRPAKFTPHEHESGGKGGGEVSSFSYSIDYLDIALCESRGEHSLGRIWANGDLIDDWRDGSTVTEHLPLVFYNGASDQEPDPTEEAVHGVGTVSAYRGIARVVFTDLGLSRWGNTVPQFNFEIIQGQIHTDHILQLESYTNSSGVTFSAGDHALSPIIVSWPSPGSTDKITIANAVGDNFSGFGSDHTYTFDSTTLLNDASTAVGGTFPAYIFESGDLQYAGVGTYKYANGSTASMWARVNVRVDGKSNTFPGSFIAYPVVVGSAPTHGGGGWTGSNFLGIAGLDPLDKPRGVCLSQDGKCCFVTVTSAAAAAANGAFYTVVDKWYKIIDGAVVSSGGIGSVEVAIFNALGPRVYGTGLNEVAMMENDYETMWAFTTNIPTAFVYGIDDSGNLVQSPQHIVPAAINGGLALTGAVPWVGSCQVLAEGCLCGYANGDNLFLVERCTRSIGQVLLSDIVADLCTRGKLTTDQYDVSDIPIPVRGYLLDQVPITPRSACEALLPLFFVRAYDSFGVATFVKAGKAAIVSIANDDLAYHLAGEALPARVHIDRGPDENIPAQFVLNYPNAQADFQKGSQPSPKRMVGESTGKTVINTTVVLIDSEAKAIVDAFARIAADERDPIIFYTGRKFIQYEVVDVMTVDGMDVWITDKNESVKGVIEWKGRRSRQASYAQGGVAGAGGYIPQTIPTPQETELAMIDGPFIGEDPRQGLIPFVVQGALRRSYRGTQLNKSIDGVNYTPILTATAAGTIGVTESKLGNYGGIAFDEENVLLVAIPPGGADLSSAARGACLDGANQAIVGPDQNGVRGERINYRDVDLLSTDSDGTRHYALTGMLRGRYGTRPLMAGHASGEKFIPLPTPSTIALQRTDLGVMRDYKAPTLGRPLSSAAVYPFNSHGLPFAARQPRFVRMGFLGAPGSSDILIEWDRDSRVYQGWLNFVGPTGIDGPPLGEEREEYQVRIFADGTKQTIQNRYSATPSAAIALGDPPESYRYTQTQQTTDFGAALSVPPALNVAQWCSIGWGWDSDGGAPVFVLSNPPSNYVPPSPPISDPRVVQVTIPWSPPVSTINITGLGPDSIVVIAIPIGSTPTTTIPVLINAAEYNSPPTGRIWTLSTTPNDFGPQGHPNACSQGQATNSITAQFMVGSGGYLSNASFPTFPASSTIYLNVKMAPTSATVLDMFATLKNFP